MGPLVEFHWMRGAWVHGLQAGQSRGPGSTHREVTYLQLSSPAICICLTY